MSFPALGGAGNVGNEMSQVLNLLQSIAGGNQSQNCQGQDGSQGQGQNQKQFEKILHELKSLVGQLDGQSGTNGGGM